MKIFYWSPFLSNIATVDSVINSIKSITKYDKGKKFYPYIVDATGEWTTQKKKIKDLKLISLYNKGYYKFLPKGGYIYSRISQIIIFVFSFFKLRKLLKRNEPEYFIAHLIISLPILLFYFFNFKTKLIIRISGTPKLNFVRKFFWSKFSKKIEHVTCPTRTSYNMLKDLKIFPESKLQILYDPIISINQIMHDKKKLIEQFLKNEDYILSIGRLTKQKNFILLINAFHEIKKKLPEFKLVILGEGEQRKMLEKQIKTHKLQSSVFMLGYKSNVFKYIYNCKCFISSSFYEDPGFSIIESGCLNKIVIASDSKTGPTEILDNSKRGFLFKNNDVHSLVNKFFEFYGSKEEILNTKKIEIKKYSKNFTLFSHYKKLRKILS